MRGRFSLLVCLAATAVVLVAAALLAAHGGTPAVAKNVVWAI